MSDSLTVEQCKRKINIGTHSGDFQVDEIGGVHITKTVLESLLGDAIVVVIRTRDPEILKHCHIKIDVGQKHTEGVHNLATLLEHLEENIPVELDHHHQKFALKHTDGNTYASTGLVWDILGEEYIMIRLRALGLCTDDVDDKVAAMHEAIRDSVVSRVDGIDNIGIQAVEEKERYYHCISKRVTQLNPIQDEPEERERCFWKAMEMFAATMDAVIQYYYHSQPSHHTVAEVWEEALPDDVEPIVAEILQSDELQTQCAALKENDIIPELNDDIKNVADTFRKEFQAELQSPHPGIIGMIAEAVSLQSREDAAKYLRDRVFEQCLRIVWRPKTIRGIVRNALEKVEPKQLWLDVRGYNVTFAARQILNQRNETSEHPIDFILSSIEETGTVQFCPVNKEKTPVPEAWIGLSEEKLREICNVEDAVYAHRMGIGAKSFEGAYAMLKQMQ